MEAIIDSNPSEWPEIVQHHDGAVPGLLLSHLVAKAAPATRSAAGAVLGLLLPSE